VTTSKSSYSLPRVTGAWRAAFPENSHRHERQTVYSEPDPVGLFGAGWLSLALPALESLEACTYARMAVCGGCTTTQGAGPPDIEFLY
jgi:hypothetical protein